MYYIFVWSLLQINHKNLKQLKSFFYVRDNSKIDCSIHLIISADWSSTINFVIDLLLPHLIIMD